MGGFFLFLGGLKSEVGRTAGEVFMVGLMGVLLHLKPQSRAPLNPGPSAG